LKRESKYNLSDDDEDEANVHNMLSEKDDFDEEVPLDDGSDDEGMIIIVSLVGIQSSPVFVIVLSL
jgi:nucleolar protein 14